MEDKLHIYEQVMLLALKDTEGTIEPLVNYQYALAGAFIAELLYLKTIHTEKTKFGSTLIHFTDDQNIKDDILLECLEKIKSGKHDSRIETWVSKFANFHYLKNRVAEKLVSRGILKADEDKVLLIFKRKIYPEINPVPEKEIIDRARKAILYDQEDIDPETIILLSIAKSTGLLRTIITRPEEKQFKDRIEKLINGKLTGKAAKEAIDAIQAAIMVAVIIPAVTATSSS